MRKIIILIVTLLVMFPSCKKDSNGVELKKMTIQTRVLSSDEKNLVEKMKYASIALKETMKKDKELSGLFKDEIQVLYKKSNWKEAFSFKQLLNPQEPVFKSLKVGKTSGVSSKLSEKFTAGFMRNLKSVSKGLKIAALIDVQLDMVDGLQVYYPYSDEFAGTPTPNYTYTYDPLTNDAENYGWVYDAATDQDVQVIVNDEYAYHHPTLIVMQEDIADATPIEIDAPNNATQQGNINQLNIGSVKCDEQYGELFTGGPDLRFLVFLPGDIEKSYTTANQVFAGKSEVPPICLSRGNVRKHQWVEENLTFLSNWRPEYITTHWGIYEDDSHNWLNGGSTVTFDTKGTYKPKDLPEVSADFKIEVKGAGSDKVGEVTWDRESFLALNNFVPTGTYYGLPPYEVRQDPVTGKNYRVYQIGAVHFTLPNYQY